MTKPKDKGQAPKADQQQEELPDTLLDKVAGGNKSGRDMTPGKQ